MSKLAKHNSLKQVRKALGDRDLNALDREMEKLAKQLDLPHEDIVYMKDTFMLLAMARQYFFTPYNDNIRKRLKREKRKYKARYPKGSRPRYRIKLDFEPFQINSRILHWGFKFLLRRQRGYRLLDQLFVIHLLSMIYHWVSRSRSEWIPKFAKKSAMGIDTIFR